MGLSIKNLNIIFLIVHLSECTYMGSEECLRENIKKGGEGNLKFDDNLPFYQHELVDTTPENQSEYDFIVIGAGSAGATMAGRLSEIENIKVLLIEAGSKEYPIMDIPMIYYISQLSHETNWDYRTETSNTHCLGMENSQCRLPKGKVMGGTSVLNAMIATRVHKKDYDDWAQITGNESWSHREMLRYLKKLEDAHVKRVTVDYELRNKGGPEPVTTLPEYTPKITEYFMEAGKELGYPFLDYNGKDLAGFSYIQFTIRNGERWSTNRAYLHPAKGRKHLFLTRNSHVNRVLINKQTKLAYGVEFSKAGKIIQVKAKKEIILSAGAINSPKILMLSGIGPASHLQELNINVIKDSPVGENFMDHIAYGGLIFTTNQSLPKDIHNVLDPANPAIKCYLNDRSGPLSIPKLENVGYINVDDLNPHTKEPNIEILLGTSDGIKNSILANLTGIAEKYRKIMDAHIFENTSFTLWPMIMKPKSRGKIMLRSNDPCDKPKIYANYLSDPEDVRISIKGIRFAIQLTKTNIFQQYDTKMYDVPLPNCQKYEYDSDAFWECASRTYTITIHHQSGTCKMGREDDPTSVLNSKLQVIGIKGLRVVDASIMPNIVSAHPNIAIISISEKTADDIKKDWNYT